MRTLLLLSMIGLLLGMGTSTGSAFAQAPSPPPPPSAAPSVPPLQADDLVWTVAQEPPLHDLRVAMALATLMTPPVQAAVGPAPRVVAVTLRPPDVRPEAIPTGDVPLLLRAAGFPQHPPFVAVGPCKVWTAPPVATPHTTVQPHQVAPLLGQALHDALHSLGVPVQPCVSVGRPEEAHVLVWRAGDPPPPVPRRQQPTFLSWEGYPPPTPPPARLPRTGTGLRSGVDSDAALGTTVLGASPCWVRSAPGRWFGASGERPR